MLDETLDESTLNIESIYRENKGLLQGHFLLRSGHHTEFYLQSAKVLENPHTAELLAKELAKQIRAFSVIHRLNIECVCSPALGGILAGYELARALNVRFIFTERVSGEMTLRRGFEVKNGEGVIICEDIITTGGSAMESAECVKRAGGKILAFAGLANRGFCRRVLIESAFKSHHKITTDSKYSTLVSYEDSIKKDSEVIKYNMQSSKTVCRLDACLPLFALADFNFEIYSKQDCPMCRESKIPVYRPGSKN